ncbi:hypothetical protein DPMN_176376 [Dreissena polymorpha]|uniref:Uncharacterized protein n=1 Tax=Dreissena polymorpha TaxID=45954 RepID=A0A9D4IGV1_DREPO|nr:hypothetical protein DPMN_176376 [Dreissena polymorpha]
MRLGSECVSSASTMFGPSALATSILLHNSSLEILNCQRILRIFLRQELMKTCTTFLQLQFQSGYKKMMVRRNVCSSLDTCILKRATKLPMHRWSIWFPVDTSGDIQVALCILL